MKLHNGERPLLQRLKKVQPLMLAHTKKRWEFEERKDMGKTPLKQFEGSEGRRHLIRALTLQPLIHEQNLAIAAARRLKLEAIPAGTNLIQQGASDTDIFLILEGEFSIALDGHVVAGVKAGQHVGEMAVVDPQTSRSATVAAVSNSIVARITEPDFSALADRFPQLWRRIALELAGRLRKEFTGDRAREKAGRAA
jgi:CRP/FNR family cyclic AMP-dependent transcriptional regulator